jgi:hypothetical protein
VKILKATGPTLGKALLDKERCRAEQHHLDRSPGARILVPQPFDRLGPSKRLLHLVDDEDRAGRTDSQARSLPLLRDPVRAVQGGLIGADEADSTVMLAVTCCTKVVLPTWRAPATTWMCRRGSESRRASSAP